MNTNGYGVSLLSDKNVLNVNFGNGHGNSEYIKPMNCILCVNFLVLNYISIKMLKFFFVIP